MPLKTRDDLSMAYTPGVARVCLALADHPEDVRRLTIKGNTVAVVTDGSAVLGLGDIGPGAALPVMEGKAALFKRFADIDAWPICLDTQDVDEIVRTVELIAPGFGGINLEDIAAPALLRDRGAAAREARHPGLPRRPARDGDRRAGRAAERPAGGGQAAGGREDRRRRWRRGRDGDRAPAAGGRRGPGARVGPGGHPLAGRRPARPGQARARRSAPTRRGERGELPDALVGADVFIGVSAGNVLAVEDLARMAPRAIVFPMANPTPEVDPVRAREYAAIVASGRSDLPNQINNVLAFPGVFRGLLDARATEISDGMLLAAAEALRRRRPRRPAQRQLHHPERLRPRGDARGGRRGRRPGPRRSPARPRACATRTTTPPDRTGVRLLDAVEARRATVCRA